MRSPFTQLPERVVKLARDTGDTGEDGKPVVVELAITLRPYPLGYPERVGTVYPPPKVYLNGEERPDPTYADDYNTRRAMILLARCMGDQLDTPPPTSNRREDWHAYADAVQREMEAAHLAPGDVQALIAGAMAVSMGRGVMGKPKAAS